MPTLALEPDYQRIHTIHSSLDFEINGPKERVVTLLLEVVQLEYGENISLPRPFF